ncbi:hypothetical protein [Lapidilactobacillus dextrinicus]|uniref:hypothetical protein n=1 Tax=Lapidilactobacillus dextrinicus TaxID=51664 RepID=UPI003F228172
MALRAYRDFNKMTSIINAKDVSASNKDDRYYCITPDCKAEFYYRMKNDRWLNFMAVSKSGL